MLLDWPFPMNLKWDPVSRASHNQFYLQTTETVSSSSPRRESSLSFRHRHRVEHCLGSSPPLEGRETREGRKTREGRESPLSLPSRSATASPDVDTDSHLITFQ